MIREIDTNEIREAVRSLALTACRRMEPHARAALERACVNETCANARYAMDMLLENDRIAREREMPLCQDTGMAIVFLELGQDVHLTGAPLREAVNEGVRRAWREGCFRMSVLDPVTRVNTEDNTPAVLHTELVPGDRIKVSFLAKGFGSENMTRLYMLTPAQGLPAAVEKVTEAVVSAGANPCPPVFVGVGMGGTADKAMELSKRALLRPIGTPNPRADLDELERRMLEAINASRVGAQGFTGDTTALAVHIEAFPTHICALPVAVNIQCNAVRCASLTL